ncbi:MAG: hypothetical protein GKR89_10965 [Candidatus Latescibacteria bacterium]|nr:hypothetical protein [Candidatus Latescibacterota bacterium]
MGLVFYLASITAAAAGTWRVGDTGQPWNLYPVSFALNVGENFKPDYVWGGSYTMEVVVDDDGDGLIDEDPIDLVDNDGDGLINEDPADGLDNDKDGRIDEDPVDLQRDNDGDGLINEDGLITGRLIYSPTLRDNLTSEPFFRYATPEDAAADPEGPGFGYGDDDYDGRFNEDPLDGRDNDGDGLVDEDTTEPQPGLPQTWSRSWFTYDTDQVGSVEQRQALGFAFSPEEGLYRAQDSNGQIVEARLTAGQFSPKDWLRPIRLDSQRNAVRLAGDRFMSGLFGNSDPLDSQRYGAQLTGTAHGGTAGHGQVADGDIFTARVTSQRSSSAGFRVDFFGAFYINLLRLRPRPDFLDRTPTSFQISYAGNSAFNFQETVLGTELRTRLLANQFIIPQQVDQPRPPIKEYRFDGGDLGDPKVVRVLDMRSNMPEGQTWELAEFEAYGSGYAVDASYVTEIIDVGTEQPRFRRYFDPEDPTRPVPFESINTTDDDRSGSIDIAELASTKLNAQFDTAAVFNPVTWGRVRWRGQVEGNGGNVLVRVRAGSSLDTRVYLRAVGRGVVSQFIDLPITVDWPPRGSKVDAYSYVALSGLSRAPFRTLPHNSLSNSDGIDGGWTVWSAPFSFAEGLVEEDGEGGILLPLPPLTRYIQFRFDFEGTQSSGVSLDYLEFDFASPFVGRGVKAEIFPDTAEEMGLATSFQYVLKPQFEGATDNGFNRIDIAMPSFDVELDSLFVDDLPWTRLMPQVPDGLSGDDAQAFTDSLLHSKTWLDELEVTEDGVFAAAIYNDGETGLPRLGIKTRLLESRDFRAGLEQDIRLSFRTPVFKLLTQFRSWIWRDGQGEVLQQPSEPGNAADQLPSDQINVTVQDGERLLDLRNIGPNPFTPNGDGINDEVRFDFGLFLLTQSKEAEVSIYDLTGRLVRRLVQAPEGAGAQEVRWDGRDEHAEMVPPGLYIYQLQVDSDNEKGQTITGTIGLAY